MRRSQAWFGGNDRNAFNHRSLLKILGLPDDVFDGRPVIGICNTFSELNPCNSHFRELAEKVKAGVWEAGGFPLEFPVMSLGEDQLRPTAMLFRNLVAMEVEESIRGNPIDGVVLLTGCDKTTPALLMGALSADLPAIVLSAGPQLDGRFQGELFGAGTDVWRHAEEVRAGRMPTADWRAAEACMSRSAGTCNSMGTASTMACLVEAMGLSLPGNAAIPAVDSRRRALAQMTGRRAVGLVLEDLRPSRVVTRAALDNAVRVLGAVGGSTNAVVHLLAMAGRAEVPYTLDDIDAQGRDMPCLVNLMPNGSHLMEAFFEAGGLPALLAEMLPRLQGDALTVTGRTLAQNVEGARCWNPDVIRPLANPLKPQGGLAVLRGNLAPDGAVIKPSAASERLMRHRGPALVFDSPEDLRARIDDPALPATPDTVLVLRHCGPQGYPGMPETGNFELPRKLLDQGVRDMVRISDARMSGTAFGTVVLHAAPEAAAGGPLALVQDGDEIELDVPARRLQLLVDEAELARRRAAWAPPPKPRDGYARMYVDHVLQADRGADFDFLVGRRGSEPGRSPY